MQQVGLAMPYKRPKYKGPKYKGSKWIQNYAAQKYEVVGFLIAIFALIFGFFLVKQFRYVGSGDRGAAHPDTSPQKPTPIEIVLRNALRQLSHGQIAFVSPITMKLDETKEVEVHIAQKWSEELTKGLAPKGNVHVESLEISPRMTVKLSSSASDFQITAITPEDQTLLPKKVTPWLWSVHPLDWGNKTLYLSACVRLEMAKDKTESYCSYIYERPIKVEVAPVYAATHFISNNATYTIGVLGTAGTALVGGIVAFAKKRRHRRPSIGFRPPDQ